MKTLSVFTLFAFFFIDFAHAKCLDLRLTTWTPCEAGEVMLFVQGSCPKSYQVESTYCAVEGRPECKDGRLTPFAVCPEGKTRIFIQGQCERRYQVEHTYCAKR